MPYLSFDLTAKNLARVRRLARRRRRSLAQQGAVLLELALACGLDDPERSPSEVPWRGRLHDSPAATARLEPVHAS